MSENVTVGSENLASGKYAVMDVKNMFHRTESNRIDGALHGLCQTVRISSSIVIMYS